MKNDDMNFRWEQEGVLAGARRPGYPDHDVSAPVVNRWIRAMQDRGIRGIICLLSRSQAAEYDGQHPGGLTGMYRAAGFEVCHIPVEDYRTPPLSKAELDAVRRAFDRLPRPVLVHCSAGIDRTGAALTALRRPAGNT